MKARHRRKQHDRLRADELQAALDVHGSSHPRTDHLVRVAGLLAPDMPISEDKRTDAKDRMMRAARAAFADPTDDTRSDVGSHDTGECEVHTAVVDLPDGRVILADVEPIDQERALEAARKIITVHTDTGSR